MRQSAQHLWDGQAGVVRLSKLWSPVAKLVRVAMVDVSVNVAVEQFLVLTGVFRYLVLAVGAAVKEA